MKNKQVIPIKPSMLAPKFWPSWIIVFLLWLTAWIPLSAKHSLGQSIGRLLYRKMKSRTEIGRLNLKACFPQMPDTEIEQLLEDNMIEMAKGALEGPHGWWRDIKPIAKEANVIGLDKLLAARAKGNGVLIMGGHFAAIEIILTLAADRIARDYDLGYMYRPHDNPVIDRMIVNGRNRHGVKGFTKRHLKDMIQYLKDGGMAWYGCDQNFSKSDLFVPFFSVKAANLSTPTWIAKESGAAVVFMRMHRLPNGQFEYEFSDELPSFGTDARKDCEVWNAELEKAILKYPAQYFWVHKRFKKRPPGEPKIYQ